MTKVVSLFIICHMIAAGFLLERRSDLLRSRVLAGVLAYFYSAYVAYAYILRLFPAWIDPTM